jgi:hypothetical protein
MKTVTVQCAWCKEPVPILKRDYDAEQEYLAKAREANQKRGQWDPKWEARERPWFGPHVECFRAFRDNRGEKQEDGTAQVA